MRTGHRKAIVPRWSVHVVRSEISRISSGGDRPATWPRSRRRNARGMRAFDLLPRARISRGMREKYRARERGIPSGGWSTRTKKRSRDHRTRHLSRRRTDAFSGTSVVSLVARHSGQEFATRDRGLILDTTGRERCDARGPVRGIGSVKFSRGTPIRQDQRSSWKKRCSK